MDKPNRCIIVGGGLAAGSAAEALRDEGYQGDLTLIAGEPHPPYQRPPLSKGYLAGSEGLDAVHLHPLDWYDENRIDLRTGEIVSAIDVDAHAVALTGGGTLDYDRLLLATGASARTLPIEGADLTGVLNLRTLDDSQALRLALREGDRRVVLIGSGWIGMEAGATARNLGNEVTILERGAVPLSAAFGDEIGEMFRGLHIEHGVDIRTSVSVERIIGENGSVTGVVVDGETVPADVVLIGVGAEPNVALAEAAGIEVDNGILVDGRLRTSAPDVFAAGDVANALHPVLDRRMRNEHWANALAAGPVAARSMLGKEAVFDEIPYFFTDQFDLGMEYSGYPPLQSGAETVYRGDRSGREFVVFWVAESRVVAGMNVNVWDVNEQVQRLIRSAVPVDVERLADPAVPLEEIAAE